jgi:peroxiredoxin
MLVLVALTTIFAQERFIGSPAPDFTLPEVSATFRVPYTFSDHFRRDSTRAVVVCFFSSTCDLCLQELTFIKSLTDSLYKGRLSMVAICTDKYFGQRQRAFVTSAGLTCPVLHDAHREVARHYQIKKTFPYSVIISSLGIVYTTVSGYSPRSERYIRASLQKMFPREQ